MTDQNNSTVWVDGETGDDKQQQCEGFGTLDQKMELRWALGNLKLSLKLLTSLDNSMEVTETQRGRTQSTSCLQSGGYSIDCIACI